MSNTNKSYIAPKGSSSKNTKLNSDNEELYRLLVEGVNDYAIFMLDTEGNIVTWNSGAEHIKGYKAEEIIGQHFSVFYLPDAIESNFPQFELQKAVELGKFEDEGWRLRKDGTMIWANVVITALYNRQRKHIGFSKVTRDLSERRKNEDLMFKNQELLRINTDLDNFIYTASHDLKAPIINLEGLLEVLKEDLEEGKHEAVLKRISNSIDRLKNVINDLTQVARLEDTSAENESVVFRELFEEVREDFETIIAKSGVRLSADLGNYTLERYPRKNLRSILYNLLSNALKYTSQDRAPEVTIKLEEVPEGKLMLTVADNGLGLSETQKLKIFSMYRRMHTHVEGSGLGLYIVKRILENNGDKIEVDSEEGVGSVFRVYFKM